MTEPLDALDDTKSDSSELKSRIMAVGRDLAAGIGSVLDAIPYGTHAPAALARTMGVDKLLAGRVLKALRNPDPMAVLNTAPGPDPLRRLLRAARRQGVAPETIAAAEEAVRRFEALIRQEAGDRSALDAMLSAWLPAARAEFELRRKQTVFRGMSQLLGVATDKHVTTIMLNLSPDGVHLDVMCLFGMLGLQRLRPGATVKFSTRRLSRDDTPRVPRTLALSPVEGVEGLRVDEFCTAPAPQLDVHHVGDVVHYTLAGDDFGPRSAIDLVFAEVNLAEMPRHLPGSPPRLRHASADVTTPAKVLVFDVLVHEEVFPGTDPQLFIYDTTFDGVADVNDPARNIDRLDLCETVRPLGTGIDKFHNPEMPRYVELMRHICEKLGWTGDRFRGYRCRIEYPIYGSQVTAAFDLSR
jgi:hypothetical protein